MGEGRNFGRAGARHHPGDQETPATRCQGVDPLSNRRSSERPTEALSANALRRAYARWNRKGIERKGQGAE
jgi:hypothetical protein